jgi:hypothetical protein
MGFLSRIVADARADAPVESAQPPAAADWRPPAAGDGWEVDVAFGPVAEPALSSPDLSSLSRSSAERDALRPAVPWREAAPEIAPLDVPRRDDHDAVLDRAARASRAPGDPPDVPAVASVSLSALLADARTAMSPPARAARAAPDAEPTPPPLTSSRTPAIAQLGRSHSAESMSRPGAGGPASRLAGPPEHAHARVDSRSAASVTEAPEDHDDRDGRDRLAREATIAQIDVAAPRGARGQPAIPRPARSDAQAPAPPEAVSPAEPRATAAARSEPLVPALRTEAASSRRDIEPHRPEWSSPIPAAAEPVAAPRVHIGRLEVIVVASPQPPARTAQRSSTNLASRRYLRNA